MQDVSSDMQDSDKKAQAIEWRRTKVLEYSSKGYNHREISKVLQIHESTISRDVEHLRQESREALQEYISKKLPHELRRTFIAMDLILRKAWDTVDITEDEKTRLNALSLINTVMASRVQLLGDVNVVDKVINLVTDIKDKQRKTEQQEVQQPEEEHQSDEDETDVLSLGHREEEDNEEVTNENE